MLNENISEMPARQSKIKKALEKYFDFESKNKNVNSSGISSFCLLSTSYDSLGEILTEADLDNLLSQILGAFRFLSSLSFGETQTFLKEIITELETLNRKESTPTKIQNFTVSEQMSRVLEGSADRG